MAGHGGARPNAGRPKREVERDLVGRLSKYSDEVFEVLYEAIKEKKQWAVKLWFERVYGKPKDYKEIELHSIQIETPVINWQKTNQDNNQ